MESNRLEVPMEGPNETALRELYADDPATDETWFAHAVEEARHSDRVEARWAELAEVEAAEMAEAEEVDE